MINRFWYMIGFCIAIFAMLVGVNNADAQVIVGGEERCTLDSTAPSEYRCGGDFFTFTGPAGEQVAIYCNEGGKAVFGVRIDASGEVYFPAVPASPPCNAASIVLPGYSLVMNTSPTEGWVALAWAEQPTVIQCSGERLIVVRVEHDSLPPDVHFANTATCDMHP